MSGRQLKVLGVHNHYRQEGGEDRVFADEMALLRDHGHAVITFTRHNDETVGGNPVATAGRAVWNRDTYRSLRRLIAAEVPDLVHVHNTWPVISPAAHHAARDAGIPVVQTLHNYRLMCPAATFLRNGNICEDCLGRSLAWPGVIHGCYRSSRAATAVIAATHAFHRGRGTFTRTVDRYIALTRFARSKFVAGGLPAERIVVRPNFVFDDPGVGTGLGGYALFAGRLSPEKGIATLLTAWHQIGDRVPLRVAGDGPLAADVAAAVRSLPGVTWLGPLPHADVIEQMRHALFVVLPSEVYEAFPLTIVEAFAVGTPVIATDLGAMGEVIEHGKNGLHFDRGDATGLAERALRLAVDDDERAHLRAGARGAYEMRYGADRAYASLLRIYQQVCAEHRSLTG